MFGEWTCFLPPDRPETEWKPPALRQIQSALQARKQQHTQQQQTTATTTADSTANQPPDTTQRRPQRQHTNNHNSSNRRRGPCIHGHQFTTASISGTPIWYRLPSGYEWKQAVAGDTLCGACWQQFCTHRRKRARTDEVIIVGLRNQPDLNYTTATIISYDTTTARWLVDATARPGTLLRLKAENLQQNTPDQPRKHKRNTRAQHANNLDIVAEQPQQQPQQQRTQQPQQQRRSAAPPRILAATSTRRSRFRLRSDATARPPG